MLFSAIELASFLVAVDTTSVMNPSNTTSVMGALTVLLPTYIFCELSEKMTQRLQVIGDSFYGCSWFYLESSQQKMFLLPIQRAQREIRLNGLRLVECSLEVFLTVSINANDT